MHTMDRTTARHLLCAVVTLTATVAPEVAGAQRPVQRVEPLDPVRVTASSVRADSLSARAAAYEAAYASRKSLRRAAGLREQAAALRAPDDPNGFTDLEMAAAVRYEVRQRARAADLMQQAAEQAAARGDVLHAADAYLVAAIITQELRQGQRTLELARKGSLLLTSPLLTEAQRSALRMRIAQRGVAGREVATLLQR